MKYAVGAMCLGTFAYLVTLLLQSPQARRDMSAWVDLLFMSGVCTAFLLIVMFWGMFERLSDTTLKSLVEGVFRERPSGLPDLRMALGFVAAPFAICAALHVLVLNILRRLRRPHDV